MLDEKQYAGAFEELHQGALKYYAQYKRSFWNDLIMIHRSMGLAFQQGTAVAIVPLVSHPYIDLLQLQGLVTDLNHLCSLLDGTEGPRVLDYFSQAGYKCDEPPLPNPSGLPNQVEHFLSQFGGRLSDSWNPEILESRSPCDIPNWFTR
jgi:hypothetical protein